jgi:predicted nucleotidyltransferase
MKFGLEDETIQKIISVFEKHAEILQVIIYGSRAKGNFRTGSDIDLSLVGKSLTSEILSTIQLEINELNTPYLFDISIFDTLNSPDLEEHIRRVGKIFYEKTNL